MDRNLVALASDMLQKSLRTRNFFSDAVQIRVRLLGQQVSRLQFNETEVALLAPLLEYVALHPADLDVRIKMEEFLDERIEEPAARAILALLILRNVTRVMAEVRKRNFLFEPTIIDRVIGEVEPEETHELLESIPAITATDRDCYGTRRSFLRPKSEMLPGSSVSTLPDDRSERMHATDRARRRDFLGILIHAIALVSRHLLDPGHDFLSVQLAIGRRGDACFQQARNLAESALVHLPACQPDLSEWRIAQAWACYGDAFHRAHHIQAALRCLCFSFAVQQEPWRHRHDILPAISDWRRGYCGTLALMTMQAVY